MEDLFKGKVSQVRKRDIRGRDEVMQRDIRGQREVMERDIRGHLVELDESMAASRRDGTSRQGFAVRAVGTCG